MRTPATPIVDPVRVESVGAAVQREVKATLLQGLRDVRADRIAAGLAAEFEGAWPIPSERDWSREGPVSTWHFQADPREGAETSPKSAHQRAEFLTRIQPWLASFAVVERADWHVFETLAGDDEAFVTQKAHLDVAGLLRDDGMRVELRATVRVEFVREAGSWRLRRLWFHEASWTRSGLPPFRDLTATSGLDFALSEGTRALAQEVVDEQRVNTSGGLTVLDFNRDGFWDVLSTQWGQKTVLFANDGSGGFRRSTPPLLADSTTLSKFHLWIDLDNDGQEELVGTRVAGTTRGESQLGVFTWKGGVMRRAAPLVFANPRRWIVRDFEALTPCDVNGDGLLDLIALGYAHAESKVTPPWDAESGLRNLLFVNQGELRFREEAVERGLPETHFSFVAECRDFDDDGDPDLWVGNDYGPNDYYENTGAGVFRRDAAHPFAQRSFSMGIAIADYDNTGRYAVSVSNMYSHAGHRIIPLARGLTSKRRQGLMSMVGGNSLFERADRGWTDRASERGVDVAGWAWGSVFFDFDNDRDKDLYVVNGYTSHSDPDLPDF